ncbi:hypothetical protein C3K47_10895 [Solitalea longa]|uniref:Lipoprotein n=1 Tax=Solitalea longa TaxID=2079460 RepID=A0A2S5A150_9SPHI|nr:hypothetical protein [Solitalea longa]POY36254.1 hypothetical protein C3K47_10895 [Solitalea longa]
MRLFSIKAMVMLGMIGLTFTACKKEEQKPESLNVEESMHGVAKNDVITADLFEQINLISHSFPEIRGESVSAKSTEGFGDDLLDHLDDYSCAKVKIESAPFKWPLKVVLDYGAGGCEDPKTQKLRKGKIILSYDKAWLSTGCSVSITFEDYWCGDTKFDGFCKISSTGLTKEGYLKFSLECEGTKIHCECVEKWACKKEIVWCNSKTALNIFDDYYSITGWGQGSDSKGNFFSEKITKALKKKAFCAWICEGTVELKTNSVSLCTMDYGNGDCDKKATLTINGNTKQIDL